MRSGDCLASKMIDFGQVWANLKNTINFFFDLHFRAQNRFYFQSPATKERIKRYFDSIYMLLKRMFPASAKSISQIFSPNLIIAFFEYFAISSLQITMHSLMIVVIDRKHQG